MAKRFDVQIVHPFFTGLPEDVMVNVMHFLGADAQSTEDVALLLAPDIVDLIDGIYGATAVNKANYVAWPLSYIKVFDLTDAPPRVPYIESIATIAGNNVSPIPTEVACVATFRAAPQSGVPYQRLYNRNYLGAMVPAFFDGSTTSAFPTFNSAFIGAVNTAYETFANANPWGSVSTQWIQSSNAGGLNAAREIVGGWTDNSPDTQRRRTVLPTVRTTWTI